MMRRLSLEDRIRARQPVEQATRPPEPEAPRLWPVPVSTVPWPVRVAAALIDARRVVSDPLESQVSSLLAAEATEPTWYQTELASRVASDLQQSSALNLIFQAVDMADPKHDDKERQLQRTLSEMLAQGQSLINRLQRYEAEFWNPDLRDFAARILRIIHPDSRDRRMVSRFSEESLRDMYQRALAARAGARSASTGLFVRDAERVLIWRLRTLLAEDLTIAQIEAREPSLAADLEFIRWLRYVKARQAEMAEQLVSGRKRREEHAQGHVEAFGVIVGALESIVVYAGMDDYPCRNQLAALQGHLQQVEKLVDQLPDIQRFPMAKFKSDQLQQAIRDLVAPVSRIAQVVHASADGPRTSDITTRNPALNSAVTGLGTVLEYADSAARSYIEWLAERAAARSGTAKAPNFRPAAW